MTSYVMGGARCCGTNLGVWVLSVAKQRMGKVHCCFFVVPVVR